MRHLFLSLPLCLAATTAAWSQQEPHIGYAYPAGGQRGTELVVTVGGQSLAGVSAVHVTGEGVQAAVIKHRALLRGKRLKMVRMKMQELRKDHRERRQAAKRMGKRGPKRGRLLESPELLELAKELGLDAMDLERFAEMMQKRRDPLKQTNSQLSDLVTLRVTLSADAEPGQRELRLMTGRGLTNPILFQISRYPEVEEREPNDRSPVGEPLAALPVVINGQVLPGDVDRFRFKAKKGTRLVAAVAARSLIPYLADAVPGWFQATLTLLDHTGKQVAYTDDYRFHPDPVLMIKVPATGEYVLEIKDAIYRGREDFVYRIALGELPYVTSVFPLGARAKSSVKVRARGWNLPSKRITLQAGSEAGSTPLVVADDERAANVVAFAVDTLPEAREREPNDRRRAQRVELPLWLNGRIDKPGDWDVFRFTGRANQVVVVEVQARRLGSPVDSLLKLTDKTGRLLAANDDHVDEGAGLLTHQADSWLSFRLPKDGTYLVHVGDTQHQGGGAYGYRLRISPPRPDFALRVVPATINGRGGTTVPVTVHALRRDGFKGPITLALAGAPPGFVLSGGRIPAGQDRLRCTLTLGESRGEPLRLRLKGTTLIGGRLLERRAIPAEDRMQAFLYRHLVPVEEWLVAVRGGRARRPPRLVGAAPVRLTPGKTTLVRFEIRRRPRLLHRIELDLSDPPPGITLEQVTAEHRGFSLRVRVGPKVQLGLQGNLIVSVFLRRPPKPGKKTNRKNRQRKRVPLGVLPAVPFDVTSHGRNP